MDDTNNVQQGKKQWSDMEKKKTAYDLIVFGEKFRHSGAENNMKKIDEDHIAKFWDLLGEKLRQTTDSTLTAKVLLLGIVKPPPPDHVLRRLYEITNELSDLCSLSLQYPAVLHMKSSTTDELPLHSISKRGCHIKRGFESVLLEGIKWRVGGDSGFGGLCSENRAGQTPLSLLLANVASKTCEDWNWLCKIIQLAVDEHLKSLNNNDPSFPVCSIPLLHAALELVSPLGLINRILPRCDLTERDYLGRTPLQIAVSKKNTPHGVIQRLIRKYPAGVRQQDERGDLLLHLKIKAGSKACNKEDEDKRATAIVVEEVTENLTSIEETASVTDEDFNIIATIVQESPDSLQVQDRETKLPPFMLASVNKWSLDVVYGLLRTSPWVITSYSTKDPSQTHLENTIIYHT